MMIKNLLIAVTVAMTSAMANAAVDLDFRQAFGGYFDSVEYDSGEGWTLTVTGFDAHGNPGQVAVVDDGLGQGNGAFGYLLAINEQLVFTFSQEVSVGSITLSADFAGLDKVGRVDLDWEGGSFEDLVAPQDNLFNPHINATYDIDIVTTQFTVTGTNNYSLVEMLGNVGATEVPVPAAAWLFGSALLGLAGIARKK